MKKAINLKNIMDIEKKIENETEAKNGMEKEAKRYWDRVEKEHDVMKQTSYENAAYRYEGFVKVAEANIERYEQEHKTEWNKIWDAIAEVEGRARTRTLSVQDILHEVREVEKKLGLPKKYLEGVRFWCDPNAEDFSSAYMRHSYNSPKSTHFGCEFKNGSWRIISITREECTEKRGRIELTEQAKEKYIEIQTKL